MTKRIKKLYYNKLLSPTAEMQDKVMQHGTVIVGVVAVISFLSFLLFGLKTLIRKVGHTQAS